MRAHTSFLLALALATLSVSAGAETTADKLPNARASSPAVDAFSAMCLSAISGMNERMQPLLVSIDLRNLTPSTCECATARAFSSHRLAELTKLPLKELDARITKNKKLESYFVGKVVGSMLTCLGSHVELELENPANAF